MASTHSTGRTSPSPKCSAEQDGTVSELYQELNPAKGEIRLLMILPTTSSDVTPDLLACTLTTTSLDTNVEYDALSYTWGDPKDTIAITVNGLRVAIRQNLFEVLNHFRGIETFRAKLLWVDALCINQDNVTERNQQVSFMGSIYSEARVVRAWIGHRTPATDRAMLLLHGLYTRELDASWANLWNLDSEELDALNEFYAHEWWDRIWVIQEVTLAKQPYLCCGDLALPFRTAVMQPHAKIMEETVKNPVTAEQAAQPERMRKIGRVMARLVHFDFADSALAQQGKGLVEDRDIVGVIGKTAKCKATDPRDRIFGLLGLLPSTIGIVPDYRSTTADSFEHATLNIVDWTGSLGILHLSGLSKREDYYTGQSQPSELPTWVPEYRQLWHGGFVPHGKFNACINCRALMGNWAKRELHVNAIQVSNVKMADTSLTDSPFRGLTEHKITFRKWREMSGRAVTGPFWRTLTDGVIWNNGAALEWAEMPEGEAASFAKQYDEWLMTDDSETAGTIQRVLPPMLSESLVHHQRSFFVLDDGSYGVSRGTVEERDVLAVLAGFSWPVILRPVTNSRQIRYQLISSCYVDGIMYGEAVKAQERSTDGFERLVLI